jgi:hypothetical protein
MPSSVSPTGRFSDAQLLPALLLPALLLSALLQSALLLLVALAASLPTSLGVRLTRLAMGGGSIFAFEDGDGLPDAPGSRCGLWLAGDADDHWQSSAATLLAGGAIAAWACACACTHSKNIMKIYSRQRT